MTLNTKKNAVEPGPSDVAVLIVAYKSRDTIARVIDSLDAQTVAPDRVRILENGSPEGLAVTPDLLPHHVELVTSAENLGFAAGNNRLAEGVEQRWLLLLNPDAFPHPDWIEALLEATRRWPDARMFGSTQWAEGAEGLLDGIGDMYHVAGIPYRAGYGRKVLPGPEGEVFGPCGAAALIERQLFEQLGGFDERYFCYVEDVDFAFRARLAGEHCIQVPTAQVQHMGYGSSGRRSAFATYHGTRNRLWTFAKNMPGLSFSLLLPVHIGVTALLWLSAARFGQFMLFGKALRDAIAVWPEIMKQRGGIQSQRKASIGEIARVMSWNPLDLFTRAAIVRKRD
jgi:GT2 family glycosyltransferase